MSKYEVVLMVEGKADLATLIGAVADSNIYLKSVSNGQDGAVLAEGRTRTKARKKRRTMTPDELKQARQLHKDGVTLTDIAARFDVGPTQVGRKLGIYK